MTDREKRCQCWIRVLFPGALLEFSLSSLHTLFSFINNCFLTKLSPICNKLRGAACVWSVCVCVCSLDPEIEHRFGDFMLALVRSDVNTMVTPSLLLAR